MFTSFQRERLACAYFFAFPGLCYGIFTSRLPALQEMTGVNDAWIGFMLLAFGGSSFIGLLKSNALINKFGAKNITGYASLLFTAAMIVAMLASNFWVLMGFCMLGGFGIGLCDVAMNSAGIILEQRHNKLSMGFLHASFSLGGLTGSLAGSLFAAFSCSPFINMLATLGAYLPCWPLAFSAMPLSESAKNSAQSRDGIPKTPFLYACAIMCLLCFVSEGSVSEWGSLLLYSVKNAPQELAALVFAFFCAAMVIGRLCADRLRAKFSDFAIVLCGGCLRALAMAIVLLSSQIWICLCAYFIMGLGFAPIVPIYFSRAGRIPGITPARAISSLSIFAYGGLLAFPPLLGMLGKNIGLGNALWIIVGTSACIAAGSLLLRERQVRPA